MIFLKIIELTNDWSSHYHFHLQNVIGTKNLLVIYKQNFYLKIKRILQII